MARLQKNIINKDELLADIEALKKAKTDKQIDSIMKKYAKGLAEMDKRIDSDTKAKKAVTRTKKTNTVVETETKGRSYNGKYEVFPIADGYAYALKASNGEVLATSEVYVNREGVLKAIDAVKRNVDTGEIRIFADKRGKYKSKLTSRNHRVLLISSNYSQESSALSASESFKNFALKADIVDVEIQDDDAADISPITITNTEDKDGGKYEIESSNGEYSWDLKATNGQILCQAEGYTSKAGVMNSIEKFKQYVEEGTFKAVKDKADNYKYKLYTNAGRLAAVGESYTTKAAAQSAANSVVSFYKLAEIVDLDELAKEAKRKAREAKSGKTKKN